jgi:TPR repeat protein
MTSTDESTKDPIDESEDIYTIMENIRKDKDLTVKKIIYVITDITDIKTIIKYFFTYEDANSLNIQGYIYEYGKGIKQDYVKAFQLYEKASNLGNALGMFNLGWMYHHGTGVQQDYSKAIDLYEKAVELNNTNAINVLTSMYRFGRETDMNYNGVIQLYKKVMELGDKNAMYNFGYMFMDEKMIERDYDKASLLFYKSAELGDINSKQVLKENPTFVNLAKALLKNEELEQYNATLKVLKSDGTNNVIMVGAMQYI